MPQLGKRLHRIGRSFLANLAIVDDESRLPRRRQLHHFQTQFSIRNRLIAMRRIAGRKKANLLQAQRLLQLECRAQMSIVNRVEGTAENAHWVHELTLPDSAPACKAPANAPVRPVMALHESPGDRPLMM